MKSANNRNTEVSEDLLGVARSVRGPIDTALIEEAREEGRQSILGLLLSLGGFLFFGGVLYWILSYLLIRFGIWPTGNFSFGLFMLFYTGVIAVLMVVGIKYAPRENYYIGMRMGRNIADDPLTLRDDRDREHIALGFLLIIPNFIFLNLKNAKNYLMSRRPIKNSTLAAAILLCAEWGKPVREIYEELQEVGFGRGAIEDALHYLKLIDWIDIQQPEAYEPWITLTEKAKDLLKERGVWLGIYEPQASAPPEGS